MSEKPFQLEEQLLLVLSNEATPAQLAALDRALRESEELRVQAFDFLCDDAALSEYFIAQGDAHSLLNGLFERLASSSTTAANAEAAGAQATGAQPTSAAEPVASVRPARDRVSRRLVVFSAVAASLAIGLGIYTAILNTKLARLHDLAIVDANEWTKQGRSSRNRGDSSPLAKVIGRVSGLDRPVWADGTSPLRFGDRLREGETITLESGVVELFLATGAKVTLEGPAHFQAPSAYEATLTQGRLAAAAPRTARGYTVFTPTAELVDIGTQFGVMVEDSGDSELHVFDGDVVARSRLATTAGDLIHAKQDQAMRFDSLSVEPQRFAAREGDFVRHVVPLFAPSELPSLPTTDSLAVWYAADMCNGLAEGDPVRTWRDLLIGDNNYADDAWQFDEPRCPTLMKDGAGRPALRFDGWSSFLATGPREVAETQTLFVVCALAPINYAKSHHGQMLLKHGDAPSLELMVAPNSTARGWVWPGPSRENVGELSSATVEDSHPVLIAYQYNSAEDVAKLWVNGELQGESTAPVGLHLPGRMHIGCHANLQIQALFLGSLYEIVIYDRVFDDSELTQLANYFADRYDLH